MNYSSIVALALTYSDRANDPEAVAAVDNMLKLVEASIDRKIFLMQLSTKIQIKIVDDTITEYSLPTDFNGFRSISIITSLDNKQKRYSLLYANPEQLDDIVTYNRIGSYYTIIADKLVIHSNNLVIDNYIEYVYYNDIIPLSNINTTNWVSEHHPDCYVFGLVAEIFRFVREWDSFERYNKSFQDSLQEIDAQDDTYTWSGNALATKIG